MNLVKVVGISLALCCFIVGEAFGAQIVFWEKGEGIDVPVPSPDSDIVEDKQLIFDEPVALGVTPAIKKHYRVQLLDDGVVFIKATSATDKAFRVLARGIESKKIYILNVKNSDDRMDSEKLVIHAKKAVQKYRGEGRNPLVESTSKAELLRYASQQLYAPRHAIEENRSIRNVPLSLPNRLDFIYRGSPVEISPIAAFSSGALTVTALRVENAHPTEPFKLDLSVLPERVNGVGAMAQHTILGNREENNSTALFIVTHGDLGNNLKVRGE